MGISKYKKSLITLAIFAVFVVIIFLIIDPSRSTQDFSLLLPGVGFVEIILLFLVLESSPVPVTPSLKNVKPRSTQPAVDI